MFECLFGGHEIKFLLLFLFLFVVWTPFCFLRALIHDGTEPCDFKVLGSLLDRCDILNSIGSLLDRCDILNSIGSLLDRCDILNSIGSLLDRCDILNSIGSLLDRCDILNSMRRAYLPNIQYIPTI